MRNKYFNDAIIGNRDIIASYTKTGELLRFYYPSKDNKQFIDFFYTGIKINDSSIIYTHDDVNNLYEQEYIENTNILQTKITNTYFKLEVVQVDCIPVDNNIIIKRYKFKNNNSINLDVRFLVYSKLISDENNQVSGYKIKNGLMQYNHDYSVAIFSKYTELLSYQINNSKESIDTGVIGGKDYIGMSPDSSISYHVGELKPGEEEFIDICIYVNDNKEIKNITDIEKHVSKVQKISIEKEILNTKNYWEKFVKTHDKLSDKIANMENWEKIYKIYIRTILLFPLLTNKETGGIIAAVEIDENRNKSGGYAYCWTRDAVFITKALDILGMQKETEKFYKKFCQMTQSDNGMWEQRFFTDGALAPCWGYQIDETASVVYGVYSHYEKFKNTKFLKENLEMCKKAVSFLKIYVDDIIENKNEMKPSYDLWEMHEGVSTYSLVSIYAAFDRMIKIYDELEKSNQIKKLDVTVVQKQEQLEEYKTKIKKFMLEKLVDNNNLVRNLEDRKMDISLLGTIIPFEMFDYNEKLIMNTIEKINLTLRTYTGGYMRFENDNYMDGKPWHIATLWMALYYKAIGDEENAKKCFEFVINTSNKHGLLPEQVNNDTMQPAWVIGLGWSHAMFVLYLSMLD